MALSTFTLVIQVQQSQLTSVLSEPQRALLSTISAGHQVITTVEKELITKADIPELGSDPVQYSQLDLEVHPPLLQWTITQK